jgi:hypothetical protein
VKRAPRRQAAKDPVAQKARCNPNWSCRGGWAVPVITPKPALCAVQQVVPGLLKCGVLMALKASPRTCTVTFSFTRTDLDSDKLKLTIPGPQPFPGTELPRT